MFITRKRHRREISALKEKIKTLEKECDVKVAGIRQERDADRTRFEKECAELKKIADENIKKIRKQTEADIFFECEKIRAEMLRGKRGQGVSPNMEDIYRRQKELDALAMQNVGVQRMGQYHPGGIADRLLGSLFR